ncbi:Acetate kinase [Candidatus Phytoplasma pini]|uniref:Acetate kinase n=2 Tax=Candidatus Phytoplasma pini TaxID=267362 RepID=A0A559KJY5_9MOLU|nr:Acetate kinase [Candidatus Phytoplasma pini]
MSVNAGSSSLKFKLLNMPSEKIICYGVIEKIGDNNAIYNISFQNNKIEKKLPITNHEQAINVLLNSLIENKIINQIEEIEGIGHRIVQGGEIFKSSVILNDQNIAQIESLNDLAPLHNPANVLNIKLFKKILPQVLQVGVFDTTFHQTIKETNFLYATPYEWYQDYKIRKYGFHGISYQYICQRTKEIFNNQNLKMIVCHVGNGVSVSAIENGKSIDTSMGFTPLEGIPMGTRSGNIDPTIIPFIAKKENKTIAEILNILNKKSGLLGISGFSNDGRDLEKMILKKNKRAFLSFDIQIKRLVDYIASYYVLLKGIDLLVFTAGIGENSSFFRKEVVKRLNVLNVFLDEKLNQQHGEKIISTTNSSFKIMIIPTNEELVINREVYMFKNNNS